MMVKLRYTVVHASSGRPSFSLPHSQKLSPWEKCVTVDEHVIDAMRVGHEVGERNRNHSELNWIFGP